MSIKDAHLRKIINRLPKDYIRGIFKPILLTIFFSTAGYAQVKQPAVDSLLIVGLNKHPDGTDAFSSDSAFAINQRAYSISKKLNYPRGMRVASLNAIDYFLDTSRPDTAVALLNGVSHDAYAPDDNLFLAVAQWRMAAFYLKLGNYKRAEAYFNHALTIMTYSETQSMVPALLQHYGALFLVKGDYVRALEIFKQLLEKRRAIESPDYSYHHEYFNIAMVYLRMKDYPTALKFARRATREKGASGTSMMIANIYMQMGKPDSALHMYKTAYANAVAIKDNQLAKTALNSIGGFYTAAGKYDTANMILRKALHMNDKGRYSNVHMRMAVNFQKMKKYDSALSSAITALEAAQRVRYNNEIASASLLLADLYHARNQNDSAFKYLRLHKTHNDSLFAKDLTQKAADLRVQVETMEKEEEIALLKKKNEVEYATRKYLYTLIIALMMAISFVIIFFRFRNQANQDRMEAEKQMLVTELRETTKALSNHTLQMIHHRNGFREIEEEMKTILPKDERRRFQKIFNIISVNQSLDREWDNFNQYFNKVHAGFYDHLKQLSASLSLHEQRLCALIRMNLASREIAILLNIEVGSVKMAKYRLKKKLNLDEQEDLNEFIGRM